MSNRACKYFASGDCKFGDQCRYEHVGGGGVSSDPFAAPSSGKRAHPGFNSNDRNRRKSGGPTRDTPTWPLTCVAAHPVSSGNTVTGDMSQEELRALAYASGPRGMSPDVIQCEEAIVGEFQQRNNGAHTTLPEARAVSFDPFSGGAAQQQQQQQSIFESSVQAAQPPIFASAPGQQHQPIFPNLPAADGYGFQQHQPQQALPQQQQLSQQQTAGGVPVVPVEQQFAFQQVPETAPPPNF
jgi:CCCH-type zinc finger